MSQLLSTPIDVRVRSWAAFAGCLGLAMVVGCQRAESPKKEGPATEVVAKPKAEPVADVKPRSASEVLDRMVAAYQKAESYADAGTVHLVAEAGGEKIIDETANYSLTLERPNRVRLQAYQAMLVCNGEKIYGAIEDQPGMVMVRPAPATLTLQTLYADRELSMALTQSFAGATPQVMLLLAAEPMKALLRDAEEPVLSEPGKIDARDYYRVKVKRPEGTATFWIDQESFVLRRVVLPTDELQQAISQQKPIDRISLVAELSGAQIGGKIDPKAFQFETPEGAELVEFFPPQELAYFRLLGKKLPELKFSDLDGKPVTRESLAGKVTVLDFWATWCQPCLQSLPLLQKVYEQFKDNPKVAFYAVNTDESEVKDKEVAKVLEDLKVGMPIVRDPERTAMALKFRQIPMTFIIGPDGTVQDCEAGGGPTLVNELPEKIEKLLAGQNIFETPMKQYEEKLREYARMLEVSPEREPAAGGSLVEERKLPEVKMAERSEPSTLKLTSAWKCADLKSPGNLLVVSSKEGPARLLAVENWKSIAEVGADGKLVALHKLPIDDNEVIGSLRANTGADGKRYIVAFLSTQQRCHVIDEDWKLVANYPEDALKNPHSGIADVELGDLDGDGTLNLYVSYWGVVGVQSASLEGKRLWSNRSISNVIGMAIGAADEKGGRNLYCTSSAASLAVLNALGERQGEIRLAGQMLRWVVASDLRGDGQPLWCGIVAGAPGETQVVGFSLSGDVLWDYTLPPGEQQQPIEPIVAGRITRDGPGQWILPAPDGSIHFISADGKLLDKFNYGAMLQGLAAIEIDGQPALVVATENGLEAWKVE